MLYQNYKSCLTFRLVMLCSICHSLPAMAIDLDEILRLDDRVTTSPFIETLKIKKTTKAKDLDKTIEKLREKTGGFLESRVSAQDSRNLIFTYIPASRSKLVENDLEIVKTATSSESTSREIYLLATTTATKGKSPQFEGLSIFLINDLGQLVWREHRSKNQYSSPVLPQFYLLDEGHQNEFAIFDPFSPQKLKIKTSFMERGYEKKIIFNGDLLGEQPTLAQISPPIFLSLKNAYVRRPMHFFSSPEPTKRLLITRPDYTNIETLGTFRPESSTFGRAVTAFGDLYISSEDGEVIYRLSRDGLKSWISTEKFSGKTEILTRDRLPSFLCGIEKEKLFGIKNVKTKGSDPQGFFVQMNFSLKSGLAYTAKEIAFKNQNILACKTNTNAETLVLSEGNLENQNKNCVDLWKFNSERHFPIFKICAPLQDTIVNSFLVFAKESPSSFQAKYTQGVAL